MALDTDKIDDAVLALLYLTLHDHWRAWKGFDWDALDRLYQKGLIDDPVNKAKGADGVDAPQRPWCARVEVLNITRGRRPWVRLAPSVWIWRRASFRFTEPMPQELLCSARGCGGARFARSWRPSPRARSPWRPAAAPIIGPARLACSGMRSG